MFPSRIMLYIYSSYYGLTNKFYALHDLIIIYCNVNNYDVYINYTTITN